MGNCNEEDGYNNQLNEHEMLFCLCITLLVLKDDEVFIMTTESTIVLWDIIIKFLYVYQGQMELETN